MIASCLRNKIYYEKEEIEKIEKTEEIEKIEKNFTGGACGT